MNVPWLTSVAPVRLHVQSEAEITISGVALKAGDKIRIVHESDLCSDSAQETRTLVVDENQHAVSFTPKKIGTHILCYKAKEDTAEFHVTQSRVGDVSFQAVQVAVVVPNDLGRNAPTTLQVFGDGLASDDVLKISEDGRCNATIRSDVVIGSYNANNEWIYLENNRNVLSLIASNVLPAISGAPSFSDLNGDGLPDLVIGSKSGALSWYQNSGDSIEEHMLVQSASWSFKKDHGSNSVPILVDINHDGLFDLLVMDLNSDIDLHVNVGTAQSPKFEQQSTNTVLFGGVSVVARTGAAGDVNNDGISDLFVVSDAGVFDLWLGQKSSTTMVKATSLYDFGDLSTFTSKFAPSFGDIDNDGDLDLLVGLDQKQGVVLYRRVGTLEFIRDNVPAAAEPFHTSSALSTDDQAWPVFLPRDDFGGRAKPFGSTHAIEYRIRRDVGKPTVCVQLNGDGKFYTTTAELKVAPPRVSSVSGLSKSALGQPMIFDVAGVGLVDKLIQAKVVGGGQVCTDNVNVAGGEFRNVTNIHSASTNGTLTFQVTDMSEINNVVGTFRLCTRVPQKLLGGSNKFTEQHTFSIAALLSLSPIEVAVNVSTTMTLRVVHVSTKDHIVFADKNGECPRGNAEGVPGIPFTADGKESVQMDVTFQHMGTVYTCLRVEGTSVYQKQAAFVRVKPVNLHRLSPQRVIKNQPFVFDGFGLGVGDRVQLRVVSADATCLQSVLNGGDAKAMSVTLNSLNTNAKATFTLKESQDKAKVCAMIPASNGGEGVWIDTKFRITIVGVSEMNPNLLAEDVLTKSEITHVGMNIERDQLFIAADAQGCIDGNAVTGGDLVRLDKTARTSFEVRDILTKGDLCLKVNGTSFTTGVKVNVVKEGTHLIIQGSTYIPTGVETTFNLTGVGVHKDYHIKWVSGAGAVCSNTNHGEHAIDGGEGIAVEDSTEDASFASVKFTFTDPTTIAYACVLLPNGYVNQTTRIHIVKVEDIQPKTLGKNVSTEISVTGTSLTRSNMWIRINKPGSSCQSNTQVARGGEERRLIGSVGSGGSHRLSLQLQDNATNFIVCIRVGVFDYIDSGIRLTVSLPVVNSYTLPEGTQVMKGEHTTVSLVGFGLTTLLQFKFMPSAASGCNDDSANSLSSTPKQPFTIEEVGSIEFKAREMGTLAGFSIQESDVSSKLCLFIPKIYGGNGRWTDTNQRLVVSWVDSVFPKRFHVGTRTDATVYGDGLRDKDRLAIYNEQEWITAGNTCPKISPFPHVLSTSPSSGFQSKFVLDAAQKYRTCYQRSDNTKSYRTLEEGPVTLTGVGETSVVSPAKIANDVSFTLTLSGQHLLTCDHVRAVDIDTSCDNSVPHDLLVTKDSAANLLGHVDMSSHFDNGRLTSAKVSDPTKTFGSMLNKGTSNSGASCISTVSCDPAVLSKVMCVVGHQDEDSKWSIQTMFHDNDDSSLFTLSSQHALSKVILSGNNPAPALGDLNQDNQPDLVVFFKNKQDGVYYLSPKYDTAHLIKRIDMNNIDEKSASLVDLNDDGLLDLVIGVKGSIKYYANVGTRSLPIWSETSSSEKIFDACVGGAASDLFIAATFADTNGDRAVEMVLGFSGGAKKMRICTNTGSPASPMFDAGIEFNIVEPRPTFFRRDPQNLHGFPISMVQSDGANTKATAVVRYPTPNVPRRMCLRLKDDISYNATQIILDIKLPVVTEVKSHTRAVRGQKIELEVLGGGLTKQTKIKIVEGTVDCTKIAQGGEEKKLSAIDVSASSALINFTLTQDDLKDVSMCVWHDHANTWSKDSIQALSYADVQSVSPRAVGVGVPVRLTLGGYGLQAKDQIRLSKTSACLQDLSTSFGDYSITATSDPSIFEVDVEVNEVADDVVVCLRPFNSEAGFFDTGRKFNVITSRISTVNYHRVPSGIDIAYKFGGVGLGSFLQLKVVKEADGCNSGAIAVGGAVKSLTVTSPQTSTEEGFVNFNLKVANSGGEKVFMCVQREDSKGDSTGGTWRLLHELQIIQVATLSPASVGRGVSSTLRITSNVGSYDKLVVTKTSCDIANAVTGSVPALMEKNATTTVVLTELFENALVCLKVDGGPKDVYHDTGQRLNVRRVQVTSIDVTRSVRGARVMYKMDGIGLGSHVKIISIHKSDATTTCDASKSTLKDGGHVTITSNNDENTQGHANLTIVSIAHDKFEHLLCVSIPIKHGDEDGVSYRPALSGDTHLVKVSDVTSVLPRTLGHKIATTATFNVVNVLAKDKLKIIPSTSSCTTTTALLDFSLAATGKDRTHVLTKGITHFGPIKYCLLLDNTNNPLNSWEDVTDTLTTDPKLEVLIPKVQILSPTRVVKNQENIYTLTGYGLHSDMQYSLVQDRAQDCDTSRSIISTSILKGLLKNISPNAETGTIEFTPTASAKNASLCYHATADSGGKGIFVNSIVVGTPIVVIDIDQVTPTTICVNHPGRLDILGSNLNSARSDQIQIIKNTEQCTEVIYPSANILWPHTEGENTRSISFDDKYFLDMKIITPASQAKVCLKADGQTKYIDTDLRVNIAASIKPTPVEGAVDEKLRPYDITLSWDLHKSSNFPVALYRVSFEPHIKCDGKPVTVQELFPNCEIDKVPVDWKTVAGNWDSCTKKNPTNRSAPLRITGNDIIAVNKCMNEKCTHTVHGLGELVQYDFKIVAISSASCGAMESEPTYLIKKRTIQDLTPYVVNNQTNLTTAAADAFEGQQITLPSSTQSEGKSAAMEIIAPLMFTEKLIVLVGNSSTGALKTSIVCKKGRMIDYKGSHPTEIRGMEIKNGRATVQSGGKRRLETEDNDASNPDLIDGGALYLKEMQTHLTIEDVIFNGNTAAGKGGAICVKNANGFHLKMIQVTFVHNKANYGGAISFQGTIQTKLSHVSILTNVASMDGGGIHAVADVETSGRPNIEIKYSTFLSNLAETGDGGAIYLEKADLQMHNTTIKLSKAEKSGGALFLHFATSTFDGTNILNNECNTGNGGGISGMASSVVFSTGSNIQGNKAQLSGGGLWMLVSPVTLEGGTRVVGNEAKEENGGGINALTQSSVVLRTNVVIASNKAANSHGGGLSCDGCKWVKMSDSVLEKNTASKGGCVSLRNMKELAVGQGTTEIISTTLSECISTNEGGGMHLYETNGVTLSGSTKFVKNKATNGGGGAMHWSFSTSTMNDGVPTIPVSWDNQTVSLSSDDNTGTYTNVKGCATSAYILTMTEFAQTDQKDNSSSKTQLMLTTTFTLLDYYKTPVVVPENVFDVTWTIVNENLDGRSLSDVAASSASSGSTGGGVATQRMRVTKSSDKGSSKVIFPSLYVYGQPGDDVQLVSSSTATTRVDSMLTVSLRKCEIGEFIGPTPLFLCLACPIGYKSNTENAVACDSCSEGKITDSIKQVACKTCGAGKYGTKQHTVCTNCPSGWISETSITDQCIECVKGKTNIKEGVAECEICKSGKYSNTIADRTGCKECIGSYIIDNQTDHLNHDQESNCKQCLKGTYFISTSESCGSCSIGQYQKFDANYDNTFKNGVQCLKCPAGFSQNQKESFKCISCTKGRYQSEEGNELCDICIAGRYSNSIGSATSCTECVGTFIKNNKTDETQHIDINNCIHCEQGEYFISTSISCGTCSTGTYQESAINTKGKIGVQCINCPSGWNQANIKSSECISCTEGTFQHLQGNHTCIDCPIGYSTSGRMPGTDIWTAENKGNQGCSKCPEGYYANRMGYKTCSACKIGMYAANKIQETCRDCENGKHQKREGQEACEFCEAGKFSKKRASSCIKCQPGKVSKIPGESSCTECPAGKHAPVTEANTTCIECKGGKFSPSQSVECQICNQGLYSSAGIEKCLECESGQYTNQREQAMCK